MIGNIIAGLIPASPIIPFSATGGNEVVTIGSTKYHIFTSSGTFVTSGATGVVQILTAGGGGGGGSTDGGGGGAGELDLFGSHTLSPSTTVVTIGAAGAGHPAGGGAGSDGGTSSFAGFGNNS